MKSSKKISLLLGLFLGLVLIALWLSYTELDLVIARIRSVDLGLVLYASFVYIMAYFVRSVRWNILLQKQAEVGILRSWLYCMGGNFVNYMIPIRAGELVKAWMVKRHHKRPISAILPTIFIDKSFDTLSIFIVLLMLPFLAVKLSTGMVVLLALLALVFVVSMAVILLAALHQPKMQAIFNKIIMCFPTGIRPKLERFFSMFVEGLNIFEHHWSILLVAAFLTGLGVLLDGLYFYGLFRAFGVGGSFAMVLFGYTLINLSYALPQPPAQLGSNEWMMIIIFSIGFGLTKESASAIMVFAHILTALIMSVQGSISFGVNGYDAVKAVYKDERIDE